MFAGDELEAEMSSAIAMVEETAIAPVVGFVGTVFPECGEKAVEEASMEKGKAVGEFPGVGKRGGPAGFEDSDNRFLIWEKIGSEEFSCFLVMLICSEAESAGLHEF